MAEPSKPAGQAKWARLLSFVGLAAVIGCCLLPGVICRPAVDVNAFRPETGSTMDEVRALYGSPSETHPQADGTARWYDYTDRLGIGATQVGVVFDAAGRVKSSFND